MKVHINHKDEVRKCRALIKCRYAEENHFESESEARAFIEEKSFSTYSENSLVSLRKSAEIVDSVSGANLLDWEKESAQSVGDKGVNREEIFAPQSSEFKRATSGKYVFFQRRFKGKTGFPMEHTILANPRILRESHPNHNAVARGVICRSDKNLIEGMNNQHFINYSVVDALNVETQQREKIVCIESITIPKESQGRGLASELIDELSVAYPDLRIPETHIMTTYGKDFFKRLQSNRGDRFKGLLNGRLEFDARPGKVK